MFLCDTWFGYLEKLQFMLPETRQISDLMSQDVSKEILLDLVREDVAEQGVTHKFWEDDVSKKLGKM